MRTVFLHGEVTEYFSTREALSEHYQRWCDGRGVEPAVDLLHTVLDQKLTVDGLLAKWSTVDLERLLVEVFPQRVVPMENSPELPEFLHSFLDFLHDEELLLAGGCTLPELHKTVDDLADRHQAAMADPQEFGPVKFWGLTMLEHGVDVENEDAVAKFIEAVDSGEIVLDEEGAPPLVDGAEAAPDEAPAHWLPPMDVPDDGAIPAEAELAPIVGRMRQFRDWIGPGQQLTEEGWLTDAHVEELVTLLGWEPSRGRAEGDFWLEWVLEAELVDVGAEGDHLTVPPEDSATFDDPQELWEGLWNGLLDLGPEVVEFAELLGEAPEEAELEVAELVMEEFPDSMPSLLGMLYSTTEEVPRELLVDTVAADIVTEAEESEEPAPEFIRALRAAVGRVVDHLLDRWDTMGAIRTFEATDADTVELIDSSVPEGVPADHTVVELMPLGVWGARKVLLSAGMFAPTVEEMAEQPAEVVALSLPDSPPDVSDELLTRWIDERGTRQASAELATLLRRVDDPLVRLTALWMLEHTDEDGVEVVQGLRDDPVAGAAARMWLSARPTTDEPVAVAGDELLLAMDSLAVALSADVEVFLAQFQEQTTPKQLAMIEEIPHTKHSRARPLLEAIAAHHPDTKVTKAARRSLHQVQGTLQGV